MRNQVKRVNRASWLDLQTMYKELSDQHVCHDIAMGSVNARREFSRRIKQAEIEGDYLFANYLYKMLVEQCFFKKAFIKTKVKK